MVISIYGLISRPSFCIQQKNKTGKLLILCWCPGIGTLVYLDDIILSYLPTSLLPLQGLGVRIADDYIPPYMPICRLISSNVDLDQPSNMVICVALQKSNIKLL